MATNIGDISFGSFNLYNLQIAGKRYRRNKYTKAVYAQKISWSANLLGEIDADVVAFQELWSRECLEDIFSHRKLQAQNYRLAFIKDRWYDIAVAAAVRHPWSIRETKIHKEFPDEFTLVKRAVELGADNNVRQDEDDDMEVYIDQFSRSVLQLTLHNTENKKIPDIEFFAVHFKSKLPTRLDAEESERAEVRLHRAPLGAALSTIRRTAESAALRILLTKLMKNSQTPVVVAGDCNDSPTSNTLVILTEEPSYRFYADSRAGRTSDNGLYVAGALQQLRSFRDTNYTHVHNDVYDSLDHILVSEQFYDHSKNRIWSFREMKVWNDHVLKPRYPGAGDHGVVCARFDYNPP